MESKKQRLLLLAVFFCAVVLYLAIRFFTENDEARVRRTIYATVLAVEKEDLLKCMSFVSSAYTDSTGHDKTTLARMTAQIFKEFRDFKVDIKKIKIEVQESAADSEISFRLYFKTLDRDQIYYDTGRLKLYFRKEEDGRWRVHSLEYQGAKELEMLMLQGVA